MTESTTAQLERYITTEQDLYDSDTVFQLAMAAFAEPAEDSGLVDFGDLLGRLSVFLLEQEPSEALEVLPKFVESFPDAHNTVRAILAEAHAAAGQPDRCTQEARMFLERLAHEPGLRAACRESKTSEWVMTALQRLTAAYEQAGALTYCQNVYARAISLSADQGWTLNFEQAIASLEGLLQCPRSQRVDACWQSFYRDGSKYEEVLDVCERAGLPRLRRRVQAIRAQFDARPDYQVPANEPLLARVDGTSSITW